MQGVNLTFGQLNELCINRSKLIELFDIVGIPKKIKDSKSFYNIIDSIQLKIKEAVLNRHLKNDVANNVLTNCNIVDQTLTITIDANQNHIMENEILSIVSKWLLTVNFSETNVQVFTKLETKNNSMSNNQDYKTKVVGKNTYNFNLDDTCQFNEINVNESIKDNTNQYYGFSSNAYYDKYGIEYLYEELTSNVNNLNTLEFLPSDILIKMLEDQINNNSIKSKYHNERIGINLMHIKFVKIIKNEEYVKEFDNVIDYSKPLQKLEILYEPTFYNIMNNTELTGNSLKLILEEPQNEMYAEGLLNYRN